MKTNPRPQSDTYSEPACRGVSAFALIRDELVQVQKLIDEELAGDSGKIGIDRLLGVLNRRRGKMLRPGLVLLAGASCGGITGRHIRIAAIMEMVHNATLLHDDVIDEGHQRRGAPTVNSLCGNESAVLLGDYLLSRVFRMCADLEEDVGRIVASTAVRICEGELRQVGQRGNWGLSESEYIEIITDKSASFFSCCCYLGGLLAGGGEGQLGLLADFGLNSGIAFQITDDLVDIVGSEGRGGKTLGSDVAMNEPTLPVIHLLSATGGRDRRAVVGTLEKSSESRESVVKMLRSFGSLDYAHSRAQAFVASAIGALRDLEDSDAKAALVETAKFAGRRVI